MEKRIPRAKAPCIPSTKKKKGRGQWGHSQYPMPDVGCMRVEKKPSQECYRSGGRGELSSGHQQMLPGTLDRDSATGHIRIAGPKYERRNI
eukprot:1161776-Pelagomonas_calceolata.AAC.7